MVLVPEILEEVRDAARARAALPLRHNPKHRTDARHRARFAVPFVVTVAILATVLAFAGGGNPGSTLIARAYAATSSDGVILHYVVSTDSDSVSVSGSSMNLMSHTQVWIDGSKWRTLNTTTELFANGHRLNESPQENSFANGLFELYLPHGARVRHAGPVDKRPALIERMRAPGAPWSECPMTAGASLSALAGLGVCESPIEILRALYKSGDLKSGGRTRLDGEPVAVLKGVIRSGHRGMVDVDQGAGAVMKPIRTSQKFSTRVRVLINPSTFAPVLLQLSSSLAPAVETIGFSAFTRIALTSRSQDLLAIPPHTGAQVKVDHFKNPSGT